MLPPAVGLKFRSGVASRVNLKCPLPAFNKSNILPCLLFVKFTLLPQVQNEKFVEAQSISPADLVYLLVPPSPVFVKNDGLSLIDYAINASLVMSNVAIAKDDKAGLITFSNKIGSLIPASKKTGQMNLILEALYAQKSRLQEPDFTRLYRNIKTEFKRSNIYLNFLGICLHTL